MPQRIHMRDDIQLPITTGSAAIIYGWTLQEVVLFLWAAYVFVLIVTKLPDFTASVMRIHECLQERFKKIKELWRNEK